MTMGKDVADRWLDSSDVKIVPEDEKQLSNDRGSDNGAAFASYFDPPVEWYFNL